MRINKIFIRRYGPLSNLELQPGRGLQIICGRNETGKTLTIDAAIKMLLNGKVKDFEYIDRVDEQPEGYIVLEDDKKNEIKLSAKKSFSDYLNIDSSDLRNVFIIRNSDLVIKEEGNYFKNIVDRLTGMQTDKLDKILMLLKDYGRLTAAKSDASLSNSKDYDKVSSVKNGASALKDSISNYIDDAKDKKLDFLELDLLKLDQNIKDTKENIYIQDAALKKEKYDRLSSALGRLKDILGEYRKVKKYNQKEFNNLLKIESDLNSKKGNIAELNKKLERISEKKDGLKEKISEKQSEMAPLEDKVKEIEKIKRDIDFLSSRKTEEVEVGSRKLYLVLSFVFLFLVPISFITIYFTVKYSDMHNAAAAFIFPAVFLILFFGFLAGFLVTGRKGKNFKNKESSLLNNFRSLGFSADDISEILEKAGKFNDKFKIISGQNSKLLEDSRLLERNEKELNKDIKGEEADRLGLEYKTKNIFKEFGIKDTDEFEKKLEFRNKLKSEIASGVKIIMSEEDLETRADSNAEETEDSESIKNIVENLDKYISSWDKEIKSLKPDTSIEPEGGDGKRIKFDRSEYYSLKDNLKVLEDKKEEIERNLNEHKSSLKEFERRFLELNLKNFIDVDTDIGVSNLGRLGEVMETVSYFLEEIDERYKVAVDSIKIFEEIREEEETKISDLFDELEVSNYFMEITGGRYIKVEFDAKSQTIKVINSDEQVLDAAKLSKGAYDQLYMAIRIALSDKILNSEKGFFIMDDAFIASDKGRIKTQFKILKKLCEAGWSILYFSVKDEIKELADEFSKNKVIVMENM